MAIQGVYRISNIYSGKVYIGRAVDIKRRWKTHIKELLAGTHHNFDYQWILWKYRLEDDAYRIAENITKQIAHTM